MTATTEPQPGSETAHWLEEPTGGGSDLSLISWFLPAPLLAMNLARIAPVRVRQFSLAIKRRISAPPASNLRQVLERKWVWIKALDLLAAHGRFGRGLGPRRNIFTGANKREE